MSKSRAWAIAAILVVSAVVALGVGLGLGLHKKDSSGNSEPQCTCEKQTTPLPNTATQSPLVVAPSVSIEGDYRYAAVAPDAAECSKIGTRIMAVDGGSAIDAAIASILCVGIYNAQSCGIGGGHFLTYYKRSSGEATAIIAREQAPSGASGDMFTKDKNTSSTVGGKAIGIPGEVRGLYEAHKLGGLLPWAKLFEPVIKLCREGIHVSKPLHNAMASSSRFYNDFQNLKELVTNPETGNIYQEGELMKRPKLARTLEIIAQEGSDAYYNGSLSKSITDDIAEAGGVITEEDLTNYNALVRPALKIKVHPNYTAFSPPPPSSGAVYLSILNILNGFNMSADSVSSVDKTVLTFHRIAEAFKHAYSLRTQLGDYNVGSDNFKQYVHEAFILNIDDEDHKVLQKS